jgi:hypothetical protein
MGRNDGKSKRLSAETERRPVFPMRNSAIAALAAISLAASGCSGSGTEDAAAGADANLDAENFDSTLASDDAVLNEAESRQLNIATE